MSNVFDGTLKWLNQQVPKQQKARPSLMDIATEDLASEEEPIPMPDPYALLLSLKRFNTMYWEGGYADQPHLLVQELERAQDAEDEFKHVQRRNAQLRAINDAQESRRQSESTAKARGW